MAPSSLARKRSTSIASLETSCEPALCTPTSASFLCTAYQLPLDGNWHLHYFFFELGNPPEKSIRTWYTCSGNGYHTSNPPPPHPRGRPVDLRSHTDPWPIPKLSF